METNINQPPKSSKLKVLLPIIVVIAVVFVLLKVMSAFNTEPVKAPEKPKGFLVETALLSPTTLTVEIKSQGTLKPKRQIALLAEISGKVVSMNPAFTAGGSFNYGDVLVTLDPVDYQVAVSRAEASLASAQAQLDLEQAKSDQAKKDWQSFGKQGTPSNLLLNIPQLDGAKANLTAAKADLMKAKRNLEKTEIKAPFDGTVLSKVVDLGQFVGMSSQLGELAGTEIGEIRLPLSNNDLQKLNIGQRPSDSPPMMVSFTDELGQFVTNGTIQQLEPSKDSHTLMNYAVAEIKKPFTVGLFFNSYLQASISASQHQDVFAVPTAWMMPNDQVAIYLENGLLAINSVHVIHKTNEYFYVDKGLDSNDQIITTPIQAPAAGMPLRLDTSQQAKIDKPTQTEASR